MENWPTKILDTSNIYWLVLTFFLTLLTATSEVALMTFLVPLTNILLEKPIEIYGISEFILNVFFSKSQLQIVIPFIFISLVLITNAARVLLIYAQARTSQKVGNIITKRAFTTVLQQEFSWHSQTKSGDLLATLTRKIDLVVSHVVMSWLVLLSALTMLIAAGATLAYLNPSSSITLITLLIAVYVGITFSVKGYIRKQAQQINEQQNTISILIQEALLGIREIKLNNLAHSYSSAVITSDNLLRNSQANLNIVGNLPKHFIEALGVTALVTFATVFADASQGTNVTALALIAFTAQRMLPSAQSVFAAWTMIQGTKNNLSDVMAFMTEKSDVPSKCTHKDFPFKREISLNSVSFYYTDPQDMVLENISLKIKKGEKIGVSGESGAGKSTLLDLICGLIYPKQGTILVDGKNLSASSSTVWQKKIALIAQQPFIFKGTIASNIALSDNLSKSQIERVNEAAHVAQLDEFIENASNGIYSTINESGKNLSGGQRQRIAIARAVYQNPEVLVMDEPTSALDQQTAHSVIKEIHKTRPRATIIIVSHDIESLSYCDRVVEIIDKKVN